MQAALWHVGDASEDVGEPRFRVDVIEARRHDERRHHGGSFGTPIGAGEQPCRSSKSKAAQDALRGIVGQADPSVVDKAGEAVPPLEQVVDWLDHVGRARELGALRLQASLKIAQQRCASLLADLQSLLGAQPMDLALDLEQLVNSTDRLKCNRRDCRRRASTPRVLGDISQFKTSPAVRPAEGGRDRRRLASGSEEGIEPALGVRLEEPGEVLKIPRRMFAAPIA